MSLCILDYQGVQLNFGIAEVLQATVDLRYSPFDVNWSESLSTDIVYCDVKTVLQ